MEFEVNRPGRAGCGCTGCFSMIMTLGLSVVMPAVILLIIEGSHTESDAAAMAAISTCGPVERALGTPLERVWTSLSCGEYEGGGMHAEAQWSIRVRGPKGAADLWYQAEQNAGPWVVEHATVELDDGRTVRAVPCEEQAAPEPRPAPAPARPDPTERPRRGKQGKRN